MARKKTEEAPAGAPAWMATFSDLMNLLLCFFVLLFSMSTVDAEKFEMVIASCRAALVFCRVVELPSEMVRWFLPA